MAAFLKKFTTLLLLLLQLMPKAYGEPCATIEELGTPSLAQFDYSISVAVDDDGEYTLKIDFKQDENLPVPTNPPLQCDPTIAPPALADDGMPYFAFRWHYQSVPEIVKTVTGIDHVSIDYNACGHPPVNIFTTMHYDIHLYRETPEFRTCMTCAKAPGAPICDPTPGAQTTDSGKAFFDVAMVPDLLELRTQPNNMPEGFLVGPDENIPLMGGHGLNPDQQPASVLDWTTPVWIMGPYDGGILNYESMVPMAFMSGTQDREYTEDLVYEGQVLRELPSVYRVEYNGITGVVTVTLKGASLVSGEVDCFFKNSELNCSAAPTAGWKRTAAFVFSLTASMLLW